MHRHLAAAMFALGLLAAAPKPADAAWVCQPDSPYSQVCDVGILSHTLDPVFAAQENQFWCWAATISMLFAHHGFEVDQAELVRQTYGEVVDRPAQGWMMTERLNQSYVDAYGRPFQVRARVLDMPVGRMGLSLQDVLVELANDRPVVYGAQNHAMLLTAMRYRVHANGAWELLGGVVRDPWPYGGGRRHLRMDEMVPLYVAAVEVTPLTGTRY